MEPESQSDYSFEDEEDDESGFPLLVIVMGVMYLGLQFCWDYSFGWVIAKFRSTRNRRQRRLA